MEVLQHGYRIPFVTRPPLSVSPGHLGSYAPSSERGRILHEEVQGLLQKGAVEPASPGPGFYSRIFVVPKATGGFRPVIDLSSLNTFILRTKFRMETSASVMSAIREGDWMLSLDLQDAYFQVPVHPTSRKFLRFVWEDQPLQFTVLCFGLSTAPQVFTRVMAPISAILHQRGIRLLRYLDDWLLLAASRQEALRSRDTLLSLCKTLNVYINWKKSDLEPRQVVTYLGMELHSTTLKAFPSPQRISRLLERMELFLSWRLPPAIEWLVLLGHLSSLSHLVPGGRRRMRSLQFQLSRFWDRRTAGDSHPIPLSPAVLEDLEWWAHTPNLCRGQSLSVPSPDLFLYADASTTGWGASILEAEASGRWSVQERLDHITLLELRAIRQGLLAFADVVVGKTVAVLSDNTTAVSYLQKAGGTRSSRLNLEAQMTLQWAEDHSVTLLTQFVRGESNVVADCLSRGHQVISTEWTLHQQVCDTLWRLWGYPLIDLFATRMNYRLPNFVSPFRDPMAVATDAFLFPWDHMELYAFPPFHVVRKVLNKLYASKGTKLTLIAPFWPQREWFPDLVGFSIDAPRRLPMRRDLLRQPHFHRFHHNLHVLQLVGWRLSSDSSDFGVIPDEWRRRWRNLDDLPLL